MEESQDEGREMETVERGITVLMGNVVQPDR